MKDANAINMSYKSDKYIRFHSSSRHSECCAYEQLKFYSAGAFLGQIQIVLK